VAVLPGEIKILKRQLIELEPVGSGVPDLDPLPDRREAIVDLVVKGGDKAAAAGRFLHGHVMKAAMIRLRYGSFADRPRRLRVRRGYPCDVLMICAGLTVNREQVCCSLHRVRINAATLPRLEPGGLAVRGSILNTEPRRVICEVFRPVLPKVSWR
jgi:hypothetical protein